MEIKIPFIKYTFVPKIDLYFFKNSLENILKINISSIYIMKARDIEFEILVLGCGINLNISFFPIHLDYIGEVHPDEFL